jgi:hypothetical protein
MVGPEGLSAVGGPDGVGKGGDVVGAGGGDVSGGVPVLREDDVGEACSEGVDPEDDLFAATDGERAGGTGEVVLHVDDEEGVVSGECDGAEREAHTVDCMSGDWELIRESGGEPICSGVERDLRRGAVELG